jgi:ankyrin repeat protein
MDSENIQLSESDSIKSAIKNRDKNYLLSIGDKINKRNINSPNFNQWGSETFGYAPLHIAAVKGDCEEIQFLLKCGADNRRSLYNGPYSPLKITAIHICIEKCYVESTKVFLENDPSLVDLVLSDGRTLLHYALDIWRNKKQEVSKKEIIKLLFDYGVDYTKKDIRGRFVVNCIANRKINNYIRECISICDKIKENEEFLKEPCD